MLWRWLSPAIAVVEGGKVDSRTFEEAYFNRYLAKLQKDAPRFGWTARDFATSFGIYQILGENLARYSAFKPADLEHFLADPDYQHQVAGEHFNRMLNTLIDRRGTSWPHYLFSMWNAGIDYNENYTRAIKRALERKV